MRKNLTGLLVVVLVLLTTTGMAQNVAINEDGSLPNANAILDVKSFNKGILIPRVSTSGRLAIPNTKGLLVYDTTTNTFWYNTGISGNAWQNLAAGSVVAGWSVTGNSGTNAANFLGTTGNAPLILKVNSRPAGRVDPISSNMYLGFNAGATTKWDSSDYNTGVGTLALYNNTKGSFNVAFGRASLISNTLGDDNTAIGTSAMYANTTGYNNTSTGRSSLFGNATGYDNAAYGAQSMQNNLSGNRNTANGVYALTTNSIGSYNTSVGYESLYENTVGKYNTASGTYAMILNISGNYNTALGQLALGTNATGNYNTAIGNQADVSANNLTNATAIGSFAVVNASNKVRIGNGAVTVIEGQVPFTTPSDGRYKYQVQEDVKGLDFILQLRPVTYRFDVKGFDTHQYKQTAGESTSSTADIAMQASYEAASQIRRSGFIAQEVEKAADASGYDFSGIIKPNTAAEHYSLSYESFVVPLVKAAQELNRKVELLEKQNELLKQQLTEIKQLLQHTK